MIGLISRHLRGALKAIVPAGTEFLQARIIKSGAKSPAKGRGEKTRPSQAIPG